MYFGFSFTFVTYVRYPSIPQDSQRETSSTVPILEKPILWAIWNECRGIG